MKTPEPKRQKTNKVSYFNTLPIEIIRTILLYNNTDYGTLRLVCSLWCTIIGKCTKCFRVSLPCSSCNVRCCPCNAKCCVATVYRNNNFQICNKILCIFCAGPSRAINGKKCGHYESAYLCPIHKRLTDCNFCHKTTCPQCMLWCIDCKGHFCDKHASCYLCSCDIIRCISCCKKEQISFGYCSSECTQLLCKYCAFCKCSLCDNLICSQDHCYFTSTKHPNVCADCLQNK